MGNYYIITAFFAKSMILIYTSVLHAATQTLRAMKIVA